MADHNRLEVGVDDYWDSDSGLASEVPSTTATLSSTILNYQYENGRYGLSCWESGPSVADMHQTISCL
jgi:hypothetical protein